MPAYKGTRVLGTLSGGTHPKGTAPVASKLGTQGARTTDPDMVGKPTLSDEKDSYTRAMDRKKPVKKYAAGGAVAAVHKHERAMHKGKPLTKLAKGGSASSRADGCATKGKTKGRFV
jgi:hypothetical protein